MRLLVAIACVGLLNLACFAVAIWRGYPVLLSVHAAVVCLCLGYLGGQWDAWIERRHRRI
jgi:hypothetical protein